MSDCRKEASWGSELFIEGLLNSSEITVVDDLRGMYNLSNLIMLLDTPPGYAMRNLREQNFAGRKVIVITWNTCPEYLQDLWEMNIDALICKPVFDKSIQNALLQISDGNRYENINNKSSVLTQGERQILRLIAQGKTNREISQETSTQLQTVKNVLACIYQKLHLKNRSEAVIYYWGIYQD